MGAPDGFNQDTYICRALKVRGGHLSIGRGGFSLYFGRGAHLSGHNAGPIKAACIAAGLPVLDSRMVPFDTVADLAIKGPMIAVGEEASPAPWGAFSYAPLAHVAALYRAAGAEIFNLPKEQGEEGVVPGVAGP